MKKSDLKVVQVGKSFYITVYQVRVKYLGMKSFMTTSSYFDLKRAQTDCSFYNKMVSVESCHVSKVFVWL